jgi:hypothetical protein
MAIGRADSRIAVIAAKPVRAHDPERPKSMAVVGLRYREVEICRPAQERDRSLPPTVRLRLLDV